VIIEQYLAQQGSQHHGGALPPDGEQLASLTGARAS